METLKKFLEANKKDFVDLIEQRPLTLARGSEHPNLLAELVKQIPITKDRKTLVVDKAHRELGIAILEALWCGWLSQAKANKGDYPKEGPGMFKEAIVDAFEIGQKYAAERP